MSLQKKYTINISTKLLLILVIIAFASCRKEETYPIEPVITFKSGDFQKEVDDLGNEILLYVSVIHFTDGDGNIGSKLNDKIIRPCDVSNTHDYYINLYEKINGVFVKRDFKENYRCENDTLKSDDTGLNVNLTYLEGRGQSKSLVGDIEDRIVVRGLLSDTIKYDFQLCDRDNNYSNIVESPVYILKD